MHILCLGNSYTGRYLAQNFPDCRVSFLSRDAAALAKSGLRAAEPERDCYDVILDTVPAVLRGRELYLPYESLLSDIGLLQKPYIHISSTSVLGHTEIRARSLSGLPLLMESDEPRPDSERARLRLALEQKVEACHPKRTILRAAGIYGPGRNLVLSLMQDDSRRSRDPALVVNRIHVEDLCRLLLQVAARQTRGQPLPPIILAADGRTASNYEVFQWLRQEFPALSLPLDAMPRPKYVMGKVIRSLFLEELLGLLRFPDYRAGFRHCLSVSNESHTNLQSARSSPARPL